MYSMLKRLAMHYRVILNMSAIWMFLDVRESFAAKEKDE